MGLHDRKAGSAMTRYSAPLVGLILALIGPGLYLGGCKPEASSDEALVAPEGQDGEQATAAPVQPPDPGAPPDATASMDDARKGVEHEDPHEALNAVGQLTAFLTEGEEAMSGEAAEILMDTAARDSRPTVRAAAVDGLALAGVAQFSETLIAATGDVDEDVRVAAANALARGAPGSAAEARLIELVAEESGAVQVAATKALTALRMGAGGNEMVLLVSQLGDTAGDASALAAIDLKLKGEAALPYLEDAIRNGANWRQRHAAVMCVALICAGTNEAQKAFAAQAHSVKKTDLQPTEANLEGLEILSFALNDSHPMPREVAAQGLGYLGDARAARPLAKALRDPDAHVRRRAAAALVTTPAKGVQADLARAALEDADATVRRNAVQALGWLEDGAVTGTLVRAAADQSADVRRYAAIELGRIKDPQGLQALVALFDDEDEDVRWAAVQAVSAMEDPEAGQYLVAALDDPVAQVSNAAEAGLQRIGIAKRRMPGVD